MTLIARDLYSCLATVDFLEINFTLIHSTDMALKSVIERSYR